MKGRRTRDEWSEPPGDFGQVLFDRTDPAANARRYYRVSWEPTLLDDGAVVRTYGRKGRWKRVAVTPFPSLEAAWPLIRATIRTRLRHGYRVVGEATADNGQCAEEPDEAISLTSGSGVAAGCTRPA